MKKAVKESKEAAKKKGKGKEGEAGFVTPPPKVRNSSPAPTAATPSKPRKISFGENSEHYIEAENKAPIKDVEVGKDEADKIFAAMQD